MLKEIIISLSIYNALAPATGIVTLAYYLPYVMYVLFLLVG